MRAEGHSVNRTPTAAAPAFPRRVALVNVDSSAGEKITRHLLDDLAEALPVYARLADITTPELVRPAPGGRIPRCDTVLLCGALSDPGPACEAAAEVMPGTRVYALAHLRGRGSAGATPSFSPLEAACKTVGARWMGGLVVCGDELVLPAAGSPRMGWRRRWVSEPLDQLIFALLAGTEAGTLTARPGAILWTSRHILRSR